MQRAGRSRCCPRRWSWTARSRRPAWTSPRRRQQHVEVSGVQRCVVGLDHRHRDEVELLERVHQLGHQLVVGQPPVPSLVADPEERRARDRAEDHVAAAEGQVVLGVAGPQVELPRRLGHLREHPVGVEVHDLALDALAGPVSRARASGCMNSTPISLTSRCQPRSMVSRALGREHLDVAACRCGTSGASLAAAGTRALGVVGLSGMTRAGRPLPTTWTSSSVPTSATPRSTYPSARLVPHAVPVAAGGDEADASLARPDRVEGARLGVGARRPRASPAAGRAPVALAQRGVAARRRPACRRRRSGRARSSPGV